MAVHTDTPAEFAVTKLIPGSGRQTVYTCAAHLAATMRQLQVQGAALATVPANPAVHSCKGCDADWPAD
jgi:hypothetical protein